MSGFQSSLGIGCSQEAALGRGSLLWDCWWCTQVCESPCAQYQHSMCYCNPHYLVLLCLHQIIYFFLQHFSISPRCPQIVFSTLPHPHAGNASAFLLSFLLSGSHIIVLLLYLLFFYWFYLCIIIFVKKKNHLHNLSGTHKLNRQLTTTETLNKPLPAWCVIAALV